ncbi:uncharacterized protein M437DRAFT_50614, partial [Aureobasidium melanogenum CBS 110374]
VMLDAWHDAVIDDFVFYTMAVLVCRCAVGCFDGLSVTGSHTVGYRRVLRPCLRMGYP